VETLWLVLFVLGALSVVFVGGWLLLGILAIHEFTESTDRYGFFDEFGGL
jgi:ABC-type transporter Mla subunit MlaD